MFGRVCQSARHGQIEPHVRDYIILPNTQPVQVQETKICLSGIDALISRLLIPVCRLRVFLWHAPAHEVYAPEGRLTDGVALVGCLLNPIPSGCIILWDA
jgi:hypothetical protein